MAPSSAGTHRLVNIGLFVVEPEEVTIPVTFCFLWSVCSLAIKSLTMWVNTEFFVP